MTEADAEERAFEVADPAADGALLGNEPGMLFDIPHIHRTAHYPQHVIGFKCRYRLAFIERDCIPGDAIFLQEIAQDGGMFASEVLEDEEFHER